MKKAIYLILTVILTAVGCKNKGENKFESGGANGLVGDIRGWAVIPDENDAQAMIELAVRLYEYANEMDKTVAYRKLSTYGEIKAGALCNRYIFNVKNQNEWYMSEAQYSDNEISNLFSPPFLTLKYGTLDYGKAVVIQADKDIGVDKESGKPSCSFSGAESYVEDLPIFNKAQDGKYQQTDFVIRVDTVKSAYVEHNDEQGYYEITIELDVDNEEAIAVPLANLRTTVKDGKYTSCTEHIQIWDSGYYKYFNAVDQWTGKVVVKINATIDYKTYYTYDKEQCIIENYYGVDKLKELMNK